MRTVGSINNIFKVNRMSKSITTRQVLLITFTMIYTGIYGQDIPVIPKPVSVKVNKGECKIQNTASVYYTSKKLVEDAEFTANLIKTLTNKPVNTIFSEKLSPKPGSITLTLNDKISQPEGYTFVSDKQVTITGKNPQGVFYGIQTLYQLIFRGYQSGQISVPCVEITDYPRFAWRGLHLDVSRHFFNKEFIKQYIDILALHKMNTFHWHLVDDQGWRIEIKKYPKLAQVGAWRVDHEDMPWNFRPDQKPGEKATFGGYYTQEEVKEIVAYAAKRFITVIPEIEMPAHANSALAAYPEYSCRQVPLTVPSGGIWPITNIYCAGNDSTFLFLQDVLTEVMALFPSKYIHVGGDEADKAEWKKCPKCQARIKKEGLKDEGELQSYFIRRIDKFLTSKGRIMIGWDEILEGGLADNATVMSWRGTEGGIHAAKLGHDVVMTPGSHCYFDHYQSLDRDIEPLAIGGFTDLSKVYSYEPVPETLSAEESRHILGAQGNVWTEYMPVTKHVEYMALPRATALSEVLWTPATVKDEKSFLARLENMLNILSFHGINYYVPVPQGLLKKMIFSDSAKAMFSNPYPFGEIRYTTDGTVPARNSPLYVNPIPVTSNTTFKAILFLPNGKSSQVKTGEYSRQQPLKAVQATNPGQGINYGYYEGTITSLKDITQRCTLKKSGVTDKIAIPEGAIKDHFAVIYTGLIKAPETGVYTFKLVSDDGSRMYIHDQLLIDNDGMHGTEPVEEQITLEKGFHPFKVEFFDFEGEERIEVFIKGPGLEEKPLPAEMLFRAENK
jgi:hexosaminidase